MRPLQSGQLPRFTHSSREHRRQNVWPQGMKAAAFGRIMQMQHTWSTSPAPTMSSAGAGLSSSSKNAASADIAAAEAPSLPLLHWSSAVCSRSTIRETLAGCSASAAGDSAVGWGAELSRPSVAASPLPGFPTTTSISLLSRSSRRTSSSVLLPPAPEEASLFSGTSASFLILRKSPNLQGLPAIARCSESVRLRRCSLPSII